MGKNTLWKKAVSLLACMTFVMTLASGCEKKAVQNNPPTTDDNNPVVAAFDDFLNTVFLDEVTSDSITLNYSIADREIYGITDYAVGYGDLDLNALDDTSEIVDTLKSLKDFDYNKLTKEQRLTYDILKKSLESSLEYSDTYLYEKILSPTIGLQSQLPVILTEYSFRTTQDIYDYIELVKQTDEYFDYIMAIIKMQSDAGLFMEDYIADQIIDQCSIFIEDTENNYLLEIFNDKVMAFDGLTDEECRTLIEENKKAVLYNLIPAYEHIIEVLTELKGSNKYKGGLCNYPEGKRYYDYLIEDGVGTSRSIEELDELLTKYITKSFKEMGRVLATNENLYNTIDDYTFCVDEPYDILKDLEQRAVQDFPKLPPCTYTVKYVHHSLEEHMSPAFFMVPAIDEYDQNVIYINQLSVDEGQDIYTTLAHEGFPGHLLQNVYFLSTEPTPLRTLMNFSGYSEGWATYVEMQSYCMGGIDENVGKVLSNNSLITLCLYGKMDIGINAYGWTQKQLASFIEDYFGELDQEIIEEIYYTMIAEPGNYLKYIIGCLEFYELRDQCETALGENFSALDFHTAILETGPCDFDILNKEVKERLGISGSVSNKLSLTPSKR